MVNRTSFREDADTSTKVNTDIETYLVQKLQAFLERCHFGCLAAAMATILKQA